ncbi:UDP-arabinopyranose mutase 1 [Selaginella moellendorffii]|nr:UDP-arabinopyranose mutase 1 [Selaginella moellendorffii]|eukprot:XP_002993064.2 UDP-arabinopyranose mutase 1 [Selaginella moellendorffii]
MDPHAAMNADAGRDLDVVMTVSSRSNFQSLFSAWKPVLQHHHLIVVLETDDAMDEEEQDEQQKVLQNLLLFHELNSEVVTKRDAEKFLEALAAKSSKRHSITLSSLLLNPFAGSACRSFGFLVSKARYVVSFLEDVVPAKDLGSGELLDAVEQHLANLRSKATPYYFNTLYDPHRADSVGFVRGYPFSLRLGVTTVMSHGLSLGLPDYDAPTAIVKPHERTQRYVDAVVTIPKGSLFPLSGSNVAFDRRLIGPCMLLRLGIGGQDSLFSGSSSSTSVDDVWAGLCAKVVADHLGFGVKTGVPYVWRGPDSSFSSNGATAGALASLKTEFKPLLLLEDVVPFFQTLRLSKNATNAEDCYAEIARMVKGKLRGLDPSFERVAAVMETWADAWKAINSAV